LAGSGRAALGREREAVGFERRYGLLQTARRSHQIDVATGESQ
jgi:hypothetical protein